MKRTIDEVYTPGDYIPSPESVKRPCISTQKG